jgi:glycosyltransferase involved in cell wall biosynthesis
MNKTVSVIVPVYNTAAYLEKCLQSICKQTYSNLEIICIDDGSTDGSSKITDSFAKIDSRFIVVHKENGGESNARNIGLELATGDYIAFVDCDDWIEPKMYEKLVEKMENTECDLVASGYFFDTDSSSYKVKNESKVTDQIFGKEELYSYVFKRDFYKGFPMYLWCKLFKKNILYQNEKKINFNESLKLGGDAVFFIKVANQVKRACYLDEAFYHYYQRNTSTFHSKKLDILEDLLRAYEYIIEDLNNYTVAEETICYAKRFLVYHAMRTAKNAVEQEDNRVLLLMQKYMKCYEKEYVSTNRNYPERLAEFYELKLKSLGG